MIKCPGKINRDVVFVIKLYGIPNCDSCKKAQKWLQQHSADYQFIDLRADPPTDSKLESWLTQHGVEKLVNRRSTTWRQLNQQDKDGLTEKSAVKLLKSHPTLMKRPLLETDKLSLLGFNADTYASSLAGHE